MGFHEDDRIRNKNSSYTQVSITNNDVRLRLNSIPVSDMIELLTTSGYQVELEPDNTISIDRKPTSGAKTNHDNRTPCVIQSNLVAVASASRNKDK